MNTPPPILCSAGPMHRAYPGIPRQWSAPMRARAQADLDLVAEHVDGLAAHIAAPDVLTDVEDFWEPLARSAAAIRAAQRLGTGIVFVEPRVEWSDEMMERRLGSVWTHEENSHGYDALLLHPLVQEYGGRWMNIASLDSEEDGQLYDNDLFTLALGRARAGVAKLVVKFAVRKTGLFTLDLHPSITRADLEAQIARNDDLGWQMVHLYGRKDCLLVQDWVPMRAEYRLFAVDGRIISGAACIEEFTPYSRHDAEALFDTRVRYERGNGLAWPQSSSVVDEPALVSAYRSLGTSIAEKHQGTVVLDLAVVEQPNCEPRIVLVEMNTLPNAGLYASNVDAVYQALSVAADRGYGSYGWKKDLLAMIYASKS